jgi:transposase
MAKTYPIKLSIVILDLVKDSFASDGPCIEWNYSVGANGYGRVTVHQRKHLAHRFVYQSMVEEIPDGLQVLHKCDNKLCCRIGHLFLGTQKDNVNDMRSKGRSKFIYLGKGSENPQSKLSEKQAAEVIELARNGLTTKQLKSRFGVSRSTIQSIKRGSSWKHLHGFDNGFVKGQFFS